MAIVMSVWRKLGAHFEGKCLSAGQQQVRGRVYNLKNISLSGLVNNGLQDALNLLRVSYLTYQERFALVNSSPQTVIETLEPVLKSAILGLFCGLIFLKK